MNGIQATMFLTDDGGCVVCIQNRSHSKQDNPVVHDSSTASTLLRHNYIIIDAQLSLTGNVVSQCSNA